MDPERMDDFFDARIMKQWGESTYTVLTRKTCLGDINGL